MLRKSVLFYIQLIAILIGWNGAAFAQQSNKPAAPVAATPVVEPVPGTAETQVNFVRTWEAMGRIPDPATLTGSDYHHAKQSTQYVDGLGRPLQTVSRQLTPQAKDMVAPVVYDQFGREVFKYLPYVSTESNGAFKANTFAAQAAFYQNATLNPTLQDEQVYYGKTNYEASPLNRVIKTMAPGNSWSGNNKGVSTEYLTNTENDVRSWNISSNPLTYSSNDVTTNIPSTTAYYNPGELFKTVVKDEVNNVSVEYKTKDGQVVLKKVQIGAIATDYSGHNGFLCTYYVYDNLNQLRFVIPPKAVEAIRTSWVLTDLVINELCFRFEYDDRKREIAKKVPGSGWTYMIYDARDRLVFSQDANMRSNNRNQWLATLYDVLNRPVMTGMMTWSGTPATLQQSVTSLTTNTVVPPGLQSDLALPGTEPVPVSGTFQALNSIMLLEGFESGAAFTAEIVGGVGGGPEEIILDGMTINRNPIPSGAGFVALTKTFYDNYGFTNLAFTAAYNGNLNAGNNLHMETPPTSANSKTQGLITGTSARVIVDPNNLATGGWLTTVNFYDDRNRVIQINSDNHLGSKDIITTLYNFTGQVLCTYLDHTNSTGTPASLHVKTNMEYDHAGRVLEVWKTINDDDTRKTKIAENTYNELGQLKSKKLGLRKDGSSTFVETLDYGYNIRGWMTGINKDYANNTGNPNAWFGMEMSYDKGFQTVQYNGNISGTKWRSKGDGERRAYGYSYDKANRILGADFSQYSGSGYIDDGVVKFDMTVGSGLDDNSAYDENGNIKAMKQWGLKPNSAVQIDDMVYDYFSNSNKLSSISEQGTGAMDHKLGDFTDNNTSGNDYGYDENGNMVSDLNKRLNGSTGLNVTSGGAIIYNYQNLPWQLPIKSDDGLSNKGTITYVYDANGRKLKKIVVDNSLPNKTITTTTNYVIGLVYESKTTVPADANDYVDKLQLIDHEEGRTRYIAADGANPARFEYDYFVKDYMDNVRMVLTEEQKTDIYQAGMEDANRNFEVALFGQKVNSTAANKPGGFDSDGANAKVSMVNGTTAEGRVGPGIVLKVMSGDKINAKTFAWYQPSGMDNTTDPNLPGIITNILSQLVDGIAGAGKGTGAAQISNGILQPGMENLLNSETPAANAPKAYLNWILFDEERFTAISSGFVPVPQITGSQQKVLLQANSGNDIDITKNGYLYVYVSNESKGNVYFDDIRIDHKKGSLIEETHYYPFGLTMVGISSKVLNNTPANKLKYNGKEEQRQEFSDGSGLELYDFGKRMYDPQTGRFHVPDPLATVQVFINPYGYSLNNPIIYSDKGGQLPILINGRVGGASERGSASYWDSRIVDAIRNSGVPNPGGSFKFVDGDRYYKERPLRSDIERLPGQEAGVHNAGFISGSAPGGRIKAGYEVGKKDIQDILSQLAKDPTTGKYIETIQIYTHSRGAAFSEGYIQAILEYVKAHPEQFADPNKVIDLVYHMAPHQSWAINMPAGLNAWGHGHNFDLLSGGYMDGTKGFFASNEDAGWLPVVADHSTSSFVNDITAFLSAWQGNKGNDKKTIDTFIDTMKNKYGITVTYVQ